jgi:hypothetical protein
MTCGEPELMRRHFPRVSIMEQGVSHEKTYESVALFLKELQLLVQIKRWSGLSRGSKDRFAELVHGIAVHAKHRRVDFGAMRKEIVRNYSNGASLKGVVKAGKLSAVYDFATAVIVRDETEISDWSVIRDRLLRQ